ncbi:Uncharacterised protein g8209 [Pycnogonum litorale]
MDMKMRRCFRRTYFRYLAVVMVLLTILCVFYTLNSDLITLRASGHHLPFISRLAFTSVFSYRNDSVSCQRPPEVTKSVVNTVEDYQNLNFKPQTQIYWNDEYEKRYQETRKSWKHLPLKVFVVPHSHNDPGWLKTFDSYFYGDTVHILNNMVNKLNKYPNMTFLWSEVSFFAKWWNSLKTRPELKGQVKKLVASKQLELVTGGWVMSDEAAVHYYSMIDQLVEGHQWLKHHLGIRPKTSWSVDPFGYSTTMPYILKKAGLSGMVIQRTHFGWKEFLAERKWLDFKWPQQWADKNKEEAIVCHMAPFDLYSIKHSCGPYPETCLEFDFKNIPGQFNERFPTVINSHNIQERAELIVEQYGRVGSLFQHNVALISLGDDFRFNHELEWEQQFTNYNKLFGYVNSRKDLHADIRFGTVSDYFNEVGYRMAKLKKTHPTIVGDFFPYGDVYAEPTPSYWTGYFTTRPYWKRLAREVQGILRSGEILFSWALATVRQLEIKKAEERLISDYHYLTIARENLGLFQHHDAITGTSKPFVMHDYGMQLHQALQEVYGIIMHAIQYLVMKNPPVEAKDLHHANPNTAYLFPDMDRPDFASLPRKIALHVVEDEKRNIVLFNPDSRRRHEVIRVGVRTPYIQLFDPEDRVVPIQINPAWNGTIEISNLVFELLFIADLPPLSLRTYTLKTSVDMPLKSSIAFYINDGYQQKNNKLRQTVFNFKNPTSEDIVVESGLVTAVFNKNTGLLSKIIDKVSGKVTNVNINFYAYRSNDFHSGAYLFQPDPVSPVSNYTARFPVIRLVEGPLMTEITVLHHIYFSHTARIYHSDSSLGAAIQLENMIDLSLNNEIHSEVVMRIETDVKSGRIFYTDTNGFQMIKRKYLTKLPVEANYYPATDSMFIEDNDMRITLLLSHAHGVTSPNEGSFEVMLDRRIQYDDNRGLGEGVLDNKRTISNFWLLFEDKNSAAVDEIPKLSMRSHSLSAAQNFPSVFLINGGSEEYSLYRSVSLLKTEMPCDVHLLNFRSLPSSNDYNIPSDSSLLMLHRIGYTCSVFNPEFPKECFPKGRNFELNFDDLLVSTIRETSLTGTSTDTKPQKGTNNLLIHDMEIQSYNVTFVSIQRRRRRRFS